MLLEVCVDSYESGLAAIEGGADRLEVCSSLTQGGLTPSTGLLRLLKRAIYSRYDSSSQAKEVQLFVMIRPRDGNYDYNQLEVEQMAEDIRSLRMEMADGIVFGVTDGQGYIHRSHCSTLLQAAYPLPSTFHRAFDVLKSSPIESLKTLSELGFTRVLTSGRAPTAPRGISLLKDLVPYGQTLGVSIMPGAGISPENLSTLMAETGAKEYHASASTERELCDPTPPMRMNIKQKITSKHTVSQLVQVLLSHNM